MPATQKKTLHHAAVTGSSAKKVVKACTINKSPEELFRFWRHLANLPQFARHLVSVTEGLNKESHWIAKTPSGTTAEWDAVIIVEHENALIAWETKEGSEIKSAGSVRFQPAPPGQGTEVTVQLDYVPPFGKLGAAIAKLYGEEPEIQVEDDLDRFKALMETGGIPTIEGQPAGGKQNKRRSK